MTDQDNKALVPYTPRALQRELERQVDLMKAKAVVGKAVIDCGIDIHDYAGKKVLASALLSDMLLKGAEQGLNGSYAAVENDMRQMDATCRALIAQAVGLRMASMLRQAEEGMPVNPQKGLLALLGDGVAEIRDELDRTRQRG